MNEDGVKPVSLKLGKLLAEYFWWINSYDQTQLFYFTLNVDGIEVIQSSGGWRVRCEGMP